MAANIEPVTLVSTDGRECVVNTKLDLNNLVGQGYKRKNGQKQEAKAESKSDAPRTTATAPSKQTTKVTEEAARMDTKSESK